MATYQSVLLICGHCKENIVLFPRSFKKNHIVLNRLIGDRVVIQKKEPREVWYESGKTSDKMLCSKCESRLPEPAECRERPKEET